MSELLLFIKSIRPGLTDAELFRALGVPLPSSLLALEAEAAGTAKKRKKPLLVPKFTDEAVAALFRASVGGLPRRKLPDINTLDDLTSLINRFAGSVNAVAGSGVKCGRAAVQVQEYCGPHGGWHQHVVWYS
jgi:hypothetical protein